MICNECMALFVGDLPLSGVIETRESWKSNRDTEKCMLCRDLWEYLRWNEPDIYLDSARSFVVSRKFILSAGSPDVLTTLGSVALGLYLSSSMNQDESTKPEEIMLVKRYHRSGSIDTFFDSERKTSAFLPSLEYKPDGQTGSKNSLELGKRWVTECLQEHEACAALGAGSSSLALPTRLLQLHYPDSLHVRLVETSHLDFKPLYMTLSHCWGSASFLKLTVETSNMLKAGVQINILPLTFREAISVAWDYGAQYLWIDSLCIVQDSPEDWAREAATMADVYQGSRLNIAATASTSPYSGMFRERDPDLAVPCIIEPRYNDRTFRRWVIEIVTGSSSFNQSSQPLLKRAWVFQERILAPRVLHFGTEYLLWECKKLRVSEKHPGWKFGYPDGNRLKKTNEDLTRRWEYLVSCYSGHDLTIESDKLIAIAGVARSFGLASVRKDNYVAGLWRSNDGLDLLWHVQDDIYNRCPDDYRAPTWSWASINSPIIFQSKWPWENPRLLAKYCHFTVEQKSADLYGAVKGGEVRVTCHLKRIEIVSPTPMNPSTEINIFSRGSVLPNEARLILDVETTSLHNLQDVHFVPLSTKVTEYDGSKNHVTGIVVKPTKEKKGQFKRVGYMEIQGPSTEEILCAMTLPSLQEEEQMRTTEGLASENALEYESKHWEQGICMYVISII